MRVVNFNKWIKFDFHKMKTINIMESYSTPILFKFFVKFVFILFFTIFLGYQVGKDIAKKEERIRGVNKEKQININVQTYIPTEILNNTTEVYHTKIN